MYRMSNFFLLFLIGSAPINLYICVHIIFRLLAGCRSNSLQASDSRHCHSHSHSLLALFGVGGRGERPWPRQQPPATLGLLSLTLVYRLCTLCIYFTAPLMRLIITPAPRGVCAMPEQVQQANKRQKTETERKQERKRNENESYPKVFTARYTHTHRRTHCVTHTPRRPPEPEFASAFRLPYALRLIYVLCCLHRLIWHLGLSGSFSPSSSSPRIVFSQRRSLFYNFLIVFAPNLCKIAASRRLRRKLYSRQLARGGGGVR